ncbi:threonine synthase [Rhodopseudomonas julia]|uniref:Threonine synthase n=1 Tax=Rhodopseudomonas julia TaxID=200617 RepID=A0ABU0C3N7_9BRAD|nr:threonine synthase [Rhodopseudomonas julia]MDQ0324818.1 threonine synthase [Rhodopseudomonas julia]
MRYVSTRGQAPALGFRDVVLTGLASDGGLYVPEEWPAFSTSEIAAFAGRPYQDIALAVMRRFVGDEIGEARLKTLIADAYRSFPHPAVTPLVQIAPNHFLLELFHGPTLAFKDVAMQLLAALMDDILAERGERATVVGATSGDTGGAAVEAFRGRARVDVAVLFPEGRVSDVQRRQMTTLSEDNVQAIAIKGHFDDAQALVKAMFADKSFREEVSLSGVNSINWGRIAAQTVYYFVAATALGAPARKVSFTVPTGNFGNIFAGYVAAQMGLPIDKLVIATNVNDILHRTLESGRYEVGDVVPTASPSMDIQVSSNFERLLFAAEGRDDTATVRHMQGLKQSGSFTLEEKSLNAIKTDFSSGRADEAETAATIRRVHAQTGLVIDPHTAVAVSVAERHLRPASPMVTLATAHPAKFPDAVEAASGIRPALPERLAGLMERKEHFTVLPAELEAVERQIRSRSRAAQIEAL